MKAARLHGGFEFGALGWGPFVAEAALAVRGCAVPANVRGAAQL